MQLELLCADMAFIGMQILYYFSGKLVWYVEFLNISLVLYQFPFSLSDYFFHSLW